MTLRCIYTFQQAQRHRHAKIFTVTVTSRRTVMPLIELPPQVEPLLAAWQAITNAPPEPNTSTKQAIRIQDTI